MGYLKNAISVFPRSSKRSAKSQNRYEGLERILTGTPCYQWQSATHSGITPPHSPTGQGRAPSLADDFFPDYHAQVFFAQPALETQAAWLRLASGLDYPIGAFTPNGLKLSCC
jgi:hypothetical protein